MRFTRLRDMKIGYKLVILVGFLWLTQGVGLDMPIFVGLGTLILLIGLALGLLDDA